MIVETQGGGNAAELLELDREGSDVLGSASKFHPSSVNMLNSIVCALF